MKKLFLTLIFMTFASGLFAQGVWEVAYTRPTGQTKQAQPIYWYHRVTGGSTSYFAVNTDTLLITGASDSLYSVIYPVDGDVSISFQTNEVATTSRYWFVIQAANRSTVSYYDIPDSNWVDTYWVHYAGSGADSCYVETVKDSITSNDVKTIPIDVPILGYDAIRFKVFSTTKQNGNTTLWGQIVRTEE